MAFDLSEEQQAISQMALDFAADQIAPHAAAWEANGTMPTDTLKAVAELGMAAIYVREEAGGSGLSRLDATLIFEGLSSGCASFAAFVSIHNMCAWMIDRFGSKAMRETRLPALCSMDRIASYCLTEPGSGSDAAALKTRASRTNDGYALSGSKAFISGGGFSDVYVVMCRTGEDGPRGVSAILVDDGTPGLNFGAPEKKMGWGCQPTAALQFDDCRVPASNLLGEEGDGFKYAMAGLDGGRLNIAACSLGAAQMALDKALIYTGERQAFGRRIDQFQGLQFKLADMETELQAARLLLRQAAAKLDAKAEDATKFCAMAKRFVTDTAFKVANDALQLYGGYGYLADYGIEKIVRDLRVHQILEGTNEIMRVIIARAMLAERNR